MSSTQSEDLKKALKTLNDFSDKHTANGKKQLDIDPKVNDISTPSPVPTLGTKKEDDKPKAEAKSMTEEPKEEGELYKVATSQYEYNNGLAKSYGWGWNTLSRGD